MEGLLKEFPNTLVLRVRMPIVADLTYPRNFITKIIKYDRVGVALDLERPITGSVIGSNCADEDFGAGLRVNVILLQQEYFEILPEPPADFSPGFRPNADSMCSYTQIINIPNSMTVLPELLPYSIEMVSTSRLKSGCSHCSRLGNLHVFALPRLFWGGLCPIFQDLCAAMNTQAKRKLTGIMNFTNPGAVSHNEILELYKQYIDPDFTWKNFTVEEQAKVCLLHTHEQPVCIAAVSRASATIWLMDALS